MKQTHSSEDFDQPSEQISSDRTKHAKPKKKKRSFWGIMGLILWICILISLTLGAVAGGMAGGYVYTLYTQLPNISRLEDFSPSLVTKVFDRNDEQIGEFFFEKRALVSFDELPEDFVNALVAVEDKRFYRHFGIDLIGFFGRAMIENIKARRFAEGASTLTQQLTRGLFLSKEKKIDRKLKEWMLAIQIERKYQNLAALELTKQVLQKLRYEQLPPDILEAFVSLEGEGFRTADEFLKTLETLIGPEQLVKYQAQILEHAQKLDESKKRAKQTILELYANQFYWGHGAYGVQAAAKLYFGKELEELSLGECAMLAGVVQLPAVHSPILDPDRAKARQAHVLRRMIIEGYIAEGRFRLTDEALIELRRQGLPEEVLTKLETMKDRIYPVEKDFVGALRKSVGQEIAEQYQTTILVQAAEPTFKLNELAMDRLKRQPLPEKIYTKLQRLRQFEHLTREEFLKALEETLGKRDAEQYASLVLNYAQHETARKARIEPFTKEEVPIHQIDKAPYFVEHVRQYLEERYGFRVYEDGLQVYTTLDLHLQEVATDALQKGLREVQKRHGFKLVYRDKTPEELEERLNFIEQLEWKQDPEKGDLLHAIVTGVEQNKIQVRLKDYTGTITSKNFSWAGNNATKLVQVDDIILVKVLEVDHENFTLKLALDMEPLLEGALVSIDPKTGHILAMVGGYDFYRSKFNRAVQAPRQPGSSFKPFVYLTALERGFTPADIIVDEPVTFIIDPRTEDFWSPKNFSATHKGPMTLRRALESSTNVIAAKLIDLVDPHAVVDTARRLGITSYLNPYPSLALGSSEVFLIELVSAYCTFANRGYRVEPIFVTKVLDRDGNVLEENIPRARQVVSEDTNYILVSLMQGVVQRGTATRAKELGRPLAGKTGTTNDSTDALFIGYSPSLVAGVWVGYDKNRESIGRKETGGRVALPIWIDFMQEALKDTPIEEFPVPAGVSFVQIDPETGLLAAPQCGGDPFTEVFRKGTEPKEYCYQYQGFSYR